MTTSNLFGNLGVSDETAASPAEETAVEEAAPAELFAEEPEQEPEPTELDMLKARAKMMGITFPNNIGVDALKAKIQSKLDGDAEVSAAKTEEVAATDEPKAAAPEPAKPTKQKSLRQILMEENLRLVRIRISNLDPNDKDLPGQIFSVSNEYIGTVTKFVPFGEVSDKGYHVPYCIYKQLRAMKMLQIKKVGKGQQARIETGYVRKFAIEELPPLTDKELAQLAASQQGRGAVQED